MTTNTIIKSFPKLNETDIFSERKIFITYIYKYLKFKPSKAIEKLLEIDFIRNNYKESTLRKYLRDIKVYLNNGTKVKTTSSYVYECIDNLKNKHYQMLTPSEKDMQLERQQRVISKEKEIIINKHNQIQNELNSIKSKLTELTLKREELEVNLKSLTYVINLINGGKK